jgi:hypothetical protein
MRLPLEDDHQPIGLAAIDDDLLNPSNLVEYSTDHLYLLDGRTGETVWQREKGGRYSCDNVSGAGVGHVALVDWDNDGLTIL